MTSKKKSCLDWRLYVITEPPAPGGRDLAETVRLALEGGASVIQLRDKAASDEELTRLAKRLLALTRPKGVPLIVNDRSEVARRAGADGLHLGQEDGPLNEARRFLGEDSILGRSTHTREQALLAMKEGADYIGVGPVFKTPTKAAVAPVGLDLVTFAAAKLRIPFVAIGGIEPANVVQVRDAGAKAVAVLRAVMRASDPKRAVEELLWIMRRPKKYAN